MLESNPPRVTLISGAGRYDDPWHPFAQTSAALADVLQQEGMEVSIPEDVDRAFTTLDDTDLLVINIGEPDHDDARADAAVREGLLRYLGRGAPLLSMHVSSTSLRAVREWEEITGGIWVRGTTMHPEFGRAEIVVHPDRHPIVAGLHDFELDDERYTFLRVAQDVEPLLGHVHDGAEHPLLWAKTYNDARVVYDALGHDTRSYESEEHRTVLRRAARWLLSGG
jgi:type 1 glutamine amidotransferase